MVEVVEADFLMLQLEGDLAVEVLLRIPLEPQYLDKEIQVDLDFIHLVSQRELEVAEEDLVVLAVAHRQALVELAGMEHLHL